MSYLKIQIDGKDRGLKFNQMALVLLSQFTDKNNAEATAAYALFYAGLRANCYVKREEPDFTFEQACDWFDKLSNEDVLKIKAAFDESTNFSQDLPKEQKKSRVRKKATGNSV